MDIPSENPFYHLPPEYWVYLYKGTKEQLLKFIERRKKTRLEDDIEKNIELHKSGVVSNFLYDYYGLNAKSDVNIYRIDDHPYHLYTKPEWSIRKKTDDILHRPLENKYYKMPELWLENQNKYVEYLESVGRQVTDHQTFNLLDVNELNGEVILTCGLGRYFGYLSTCEILSDELLAELRQRKPRDLLCLTETESSDKKSKIITNIRKKLHFRQLLAPDIEKILNYNIRDLKIGLDVFLVLNTDDGPICFLYHRGKNIGEYPDINHVMPAGTFQHDSQEDLNYKNAAKAFNIKYKVLSELWEECFEGKDMKSQRKMKYRACINLDEMNIPKTDLFPIKDLMVLLGKSEAFIYVTGFGIDLLSAKPDISILLLIKDPFYERKYRKHWRFNWEFPGYDTEEMTRGVYFCYLNEVEKIKNLIKPGHFIPIGAMAVDRGISLLRELRSEGIVDFYIPEW